MGELHLTMRLVTAIGIKTLLLKDKRHAFDLFKKSLGQRNFNTKKERFQEIAPVELHYKLI